MHHSATHLRQGVWISHLTIRKQRDVVLLFPLEDAVCHCGCAETLHDEGSLLQDLALSALDNLLAVLEVTTRQLPCSCVSLRQPPL